MGSQTDYLAAFMLPEKGKKRRGGIDMQFAGTSRRHFTDGARSHQIAPIHGHGADDSELHLDTANENFVTRLWNWFHNRFGGTNVKEENVAAIEQLMSAVRYKPTDIDKLVEQTRFTKQELRVLYRGFKQDCPTGTVSEEMFKQIYNQHIFPQGTTDNYASLVFRTLDKSGTGSLTFEEYVYFLSKLSRGSVEEKLRWCFDLYDSNGDGKISRDDLQRGVNAMFELLGEHVQPKVNQTDAEERVNYLFKKFDLNGDGVITYNEFAEVCTADPYIERSLSQLNTEL